MIRRRHSPISNYGFTAAGRGRKRVVCASTIPLSFSLSSSRNKRDDPSRHGTSTSQFISSKALPFHEPRFFSVRRRNFMLLSSICPVVAHPAPPVVFVSVALLECVLGSNNDNLPLWVSKRKQNAIESRPATVVTVVLVIFGSYQKNIIIIHKTSWESLYWILSQFFWWRWCDNKDGKRNLCEKKKAKTNVQVMA